MEKNTKNPQGSSLGPTLWLLIMENLFDSIRDTDSFKVQAFTDDIIVLNERTSVKKLKDHGGI